MKLMKYFTMFTAALAAISGAAGSVSIVLNKRAGQTFDIEYCRNTFEFTEDTEFTMPSVLATDRTTCLFGDGSIRSLCTGEILERLNLAEQKLKLQESNHGLVKKTTTYTFAEGTEIDHYCGGRVMFKKDTAVYLKEGERPILLGNGEFIDRVSGKTVAAFEEGVDYESIIHDATDEDMDVPVPTYATTIKIG